MAAALRSQYAPLVASLVSFVLLGVVGALGFYQYEQQRAVSEQQRDEIVAAQEAINREVSDRITQVCERFAEANEATARGFEALIEVADADPATEREFRRLAALDELAETPPECADVERPLTLNLS